MTYISPEIQKYQSELRLHQSKADMMNQWIADYDAMISKQTYLKETLEANIDGVEQEATDLMKAIQDLIDSRVYAQELNVTAPTVSINKQYNRLAIKTAQNNIDSLLKQKSDATFNLRIHMKKINELKELLGDENQV